MKRFVSIGWLLVVALFVWATEAQACSCERLSRQQLRDQLPLSFDGYVTEVEELKTLVRAKVRVVRKLKGDISDQLDVFSWRMSLGCSDVGGAFRASLATSQILEFGIERIEVWRVEDFSKLREAFPFVGECSLSYSELDPTKGKGVRLWRKD